MKIALQSARRCLLVSTLCTASFAFAPQESAPDEGISPVAESSLPASTVPASVQDAMDLPTTVLQARLRPLDQEEALADLEAWIELLRAKAGEVRDAEVSALTGAGAEKTASSERAVVLRGERDKLIQRVKVVLEQAGRKGADVEQQRKYVDSLVDLPVVDGFGAAWTTLRAWALSSDGGIRMALNVVKFVVTFLAFLIVSRVLGGLVNRAMRRIGRSSALLRNFLVNSVRKLTFFIGIVVALSMLGVNIGPFVAAIGAAGFVIGFALQGTLSNFASGVMIMIYRPYDIGDFVTAGGVSGTVDSMTLVSTSVKTPDNQTIVIPNTSIWGNVITNVTANPQRRLDLVFGIGYGDDMAKAKSVLKGVLEGHELVLEEPAPVVEVNELADSSVNFVVRPWVKTSDYWKVRWDLVRTVKERFDAEDISIPFPQRDVHLHGSATS